MKVKKISYNLKTGKKQVVEEDKVINLTPLPAEYPVDLKTLSRLITYAKQQGWLK